MDWYRDNQVVKEEGYLTTLLGNDSVDLLNAHDTAKPLSLYLAINAGHTPYQATPEYLEQYKHIADPSRQAYAGSITAMDDQIGWVLAALKKKKLRDNTLVVFQGDNGGTTNAMFAGEGDMSKIKIPCDNGPIRDGKASIYEGCTRVCAAISEGKPSPRTEIVYNVEPFRGGIRQGDWKLVWRTLLPAAVELCNIAQDPSEKNNVAAQNADQVIRLQNRANELAASMVKPMLLQTEVKAIMERFKMPPSLPAELDSLNTEP